LCKKGRDTRDIASFKLSDLALIKWSISIIEDINPTAIISYNMSFGYEMIHHDKTPTRQWQILSKSALIKRSLKKPTILT
jgi:hypothetical protein